MEGRYEDGINLGEESPNDTSPQNARNQSILRCIQSLVHACRCQEQQCRQPSCMKMKRVVVHTKICTRKAKGGCLVCKQLFSLCYHHANNCKESTCLIPFCQNVKQKIGQLRLSQSLKGFNCIRQQGISLLDKNEDRSVECQCHKKRRIN